MRTPLRNLRVDAETWDRWKAVTADLGIDTSSFIRDAVEGEIARVRPAMKAPPRQPVVHAPDRQPRTVPCVHFVPANAHCSRGCDGS